jgi:predicted subunit of tRNA(5-methylaminomethyl-2-thiouridylate) methyltransferase
MPANVELKLDKRFYKMARGVYEKYNFDVGIIKDSIHKDALGAKKYGLKTFAGGPARRTGQKPGPQMSEISESLRSKVGNFYTAPFRSKPNKDIRKLIKNFFDLVQGRTQQKRLENTLQAVIRNPILRGDYGSNSELTKKIKTFDRFMIDTGQFFKAITAKVRLNRVP